MKVAPVGRREPATSEGVADANAPGRQGEATPKAAATDAAQPDAAKAAATDAAQPDMTPGQAPAPDAAAPAAADAAAGDDFMRDLVAAMRGVADEARKSGIDELRSRADEQVRSLEVEAERRHEDLRARAEADVTGVGEWAKAEAERIKVEAETRVVARRAQLEQQLAADTTATEAEKKARHDRVAEYERELDAFHAQLAEINDAAAFAAAAKRMPRPPVLAGQASAPAPATATQAAPATSGDDVLVEPATGASNGVPETRPAVHPAEEEVLAARLAELDATLPDAAAASAAAESAGPVTTEIVVKGLGSFGAITGFRQALSGVAGIEGVALSLGQTGEFVFRATHVAGFDVRSAITSLEGDGAKMEDDARGGLRVTLDRAR
ncbi:MAG TPA: hypothetical protein VMP86_03195 [Candidatus Binatia bacterium]|nr:hypothetical protein [Candidatus Binatia bacterium]